jgi:hypothetical protein
LTILQQSDGFWQRLYDEGRISGRKFYILTTGNQTSLRCMQLIEGEADDLEQISWEKEYKRIVAGALAVVNDFSVLTAVGGEPSVVAGPLELYGEVMSELGYLPQ